MSEQEKEEGSSTADAGSVEEQVPGENEMPLPAPPVIPELKPGESSEIDPLVANHISEQFQLNTRILQYIHDAHTRLVKVLEKGDRSEMQIQATNALNQTFRRLHDSQRELADRVTRERKSHPAWILSAAALGGLLVFLSLWPFYGQDGGSATTDVDRFARALETTNQQAVEIVDTINKGFAANRVLSNENGSRREEIRDLRALLAVAEMQIDDMEDSTLALNRELAEMRTREVDRHLAGVNLDLAAAELIVGREEKTLKESGDQSQEASSSEAEEATVDGGAGVSPNPEGALSEKPEDSEVVLAVPRPTVPEPTVPEPTVVEPTVTEPAVPELAATVVGSAEPEDLEENQAPSSEETARAGKEPDNNAMTVEAGLARVLELNAFLHDAGVLNLRFLRCDVVADGSLRNVMMEVRGAGGMAIGFHEAGSMNIVVDPLTMKGTMHLREGRSVLHNRQVLFPESGLDLTIPAVAPGSFAGGVVSEITTLESHPEASVLESPERITATFDSRPWLVLLNDALKNGSGGDSYKFFRLGDVSDGVLRNVGFHCYGYGGVLYRTVDADECRIQTDGARQTVSLHFSNGFHVAQGREIPFFQGRGHSSGQWILELEVDDFSEWERLATELADHKEASGPEAAGQ